MASVLLRRDSEPGPETGICAIVVLYEDTSSRDAAIALCDSLAQTFDSELDFEITWCRFKYFSDPAVASEAAEAAMRADLILVSVQRAQDLPLEVKAWFEQWLVKREATDGALVLLQASADMRSSTTSQCAYLYLLAKRANLDYLALSNTGPAVSNEQLRENLRLSQPAGLDTDPNSHQLSSRWGLNE